MTRRTPFRKILIANRGEIALRILRSARAAGYRTVSVYSDADARARHALEADEAAAIGASAPTASYLNVEALLAAAKATGADAVHPGYGFLAENAVFARACRDAGLVFIGPSPEAIAAMGDKAGAKKLMREAGVPCTPGYEGEDQSDARFVEEADRIGFPIMIKASAGGGGRGMRRVDSAADFVLALHGARSEAKAAFGDATMILEKAIARPRHIEIQVFGDRAGAVVHLGERDCSVQRRHQKLIEEAPSPAVSPELRARMGEIAVKAAKAIGYEGAGTLEFLLDASGEFYFMEMNTRLQVEHPVTEAVTGIDLVDLQLRIAAGDPLPFSQEQIRFEGHAIEVRLCAEDPAQSFLPQSGKIAFWRAPENARIEHALASGADIPPFYDSMIAKIIGRGATREEARRKLSAALIDTIPLGVATNRAFLAKCLEHPVFVAGGATTAFIDDARDELLRAEDARIERAAALAAALIGEAGVGDHGTHPFPLGLRFSLDGSVRSAILIDRGGRRRQVSFGEQSHDVEIVEANAERVRFLCDGIMESAWVAREGARMHLALRAEAYEIVDLSRASTAQRAPAREGEARLRASMNGRVVAVHAPVGAHVSVGDPVITIEAMKMEHVHAAPIAGIVKAIHVAVGDQAPAGRIVAEIEAVPGEART